MAFRRGDTLVFARPPVIAAWAAAGGKKEAEGPLAGGFAFLTEDTGFAGEGCDNWEQAESLLQQKAIGICLRKGGISAREVDLAFAGDLQAQCTASNYTMRTVGAPFAGLYGACSTMAESLCLAAAFAQTGMAEQALAFTSSHFCAAERQFRTPLEYGAKRTPTAQWTATAAGACLLRAPGSAGVPVLSATFGRVKDYQVHDINNMGAAMMPAAADTLLRYFAGTGTRPQDFDVIFTGDLGQVGSTLLQEQMFREGVPLDNHQDCGCLLYDRQSQDVQAGGSGAGCSASVLCAHILPKLQQGEWRRVLFVATGALMSQTTFLQGESIPGIAHCVELGAPEEESV
ncbi:MAG: stage V sporulation protein AD [Gemmiger sp.]